MAVCWRRLSLLLLLASFCDGIQGKCTTSDGKPGTCKNIRECPQVLDLISKQAGNPQTLAAIRSSSCPRSDGSTTIVCCPPGATAKPSTPKPSTQKSSTPKPSLQSRSGDPSSKFLTPPKCGKTEVTEHEKIVGGSPAELGAWPWLAALGFKSSSNPGPNWLCGGAVINERHVLTAAHCTANNKFTLYVIRLGELNLDDNVQDGATPLDVYIDKAIRHPSYDSKAKINDIALVRINQTIPFSRNIQPICLPISPELRSNDFAGMNPFVAGWGRTSFEGATTTALMELQIPVVDNESCKRAYGSKGAVIISKQLCAGYDDGGKDACLGDSGGPLMSPKGVYFYMIGVVSYGFQCAEAGFPGIYTRVTDYIDWISDTMED